MSDCGWSCGSRKLPVRLRVVAQILRHDVEGARCERLVDGNADASDPRAVHPHVRHQVASTIHHGDIHRLMFAQLSLTLCRKYVGTMR